MLVNVVNHTHQFVKCCLPELQFGWPLRPTTYDRLIEVASATSDVANVNDGYNGAYRFLIVRQTFLHFK